MKRDYTKRELRLTEEQIDSVVDALERRLKDVSDGIGELDPRFQRAFHDALTEHARFLEELLGVIDEQTR